MKFTTENISPNGTCFQGYLNANFYDLVTLFGEPNAGDEYKIDAEWDIQFEDGTIATIYNWKNGYNYCGTHGTPIGEMTEWHIGGFDQKAVDNVKKVYLDWCSTQ